MEELYNRTLELVKELFKEKRDKAGEEYINHLLFVANNVDTYEEKIVGLLHDIIEDTFVTEKHLYSLGYPKKIVDAVKLLTRDKKISYTEYIENILKSNNLLAIKVKQVDMMNNMDPNRLKNLDYETQVRLTKKYGEQYYKILVKLKEIEK